MENTENIPAKKQIQIRAYTNKQLCVLYGTNRHTLKKWLSPYKKEIGRRVGNIYTPKQVERIFEKLGFPLKYQAVIPFVTEKNSDPEENAAEYVDAAWDFARAILWSGKHFSKEEMACVRRSLLEFFTFPSRTKEKVSLSKRLLIFCQRILITRSYIDFMPDYRFVPNPSVWFDRKFKFGFNGTSKWMKKIQDYRKINPAYREELEMLAQFYQEYVQSKSLAIANKAAEYLVQKSYPSLIKVFCNCISEIHAKQNYSHAA